jgi:membrane fusion protein, multidrug efflux system
MSLVRQATIFLILIACVGAGYWFLRDGGTAGERPAPATADALSGGRVPVVVDPVPIVADMVTIEAVGTGEARQSIVLYPSVPGEVVEVSFEPGQRVDKGAALVQLDDEDEQVAVELARVAVEEAEQLMRRYERTKATGAVSGLEIDSARTALQRARLQLSRAQIALAEHSVRAPFAGIVGLSQVDPGDRVSETTPITTLDDRSAIFVEFDVPESFASRVSVGDVIDLDVWSLPEAKVTGEVVATASRIDPVTRTLRVRALVPNEDDILRPGMSFAIRIALRGASYPSVPEVSVLWSRDGAYVWRVRGDTVEQVFVRIVRRNDARVLVEGPLQEGDLVVEEGVQRIRAGTPVEILDRAPKSASAGDIA